MKKVNVAIIGMGYWGPNLLRNFQKIPAANVSWICDSDEKKLASLHQDANIKKSKSVTDILSDKNVDLVVIATPLSSHYKLAKASLLSGKHVLIEKPMTSSSVQARELIKISGKQKKQIFVGHTFIYSEPIRFLKKMLDEKKLGEIYYYDSTRINLGIVQRDANVLWDLAPHDISIICHLFPQRILSIKAIGSSFLRPEMEELVHLFISLENNILCHAQLSWVSPVKIRNIVLAGNQKMITYNDIEPTEKIKIYDKGINLDKNAVSPFAPAYRSGQITIPNLPQKEALFNELSHFISCIQNGKSPLTGGAEGLRVVEIIEMAEKSLRKSRRK